VFLWVYLVVTSLLKGLSNCDEISDLQRKLRLLPKDLKQLYIHMIIKIDEDYKEEAIQFFELINATQYQNFDLFEPKPMTVLSLCFAKEREENLPTMVKSFTSSPKAMVPCWIDLSRRLKSRTGGLLEVQLRGAKLDGISAEMKVQYLHRTVRDFLITQEMRDILHAEIDFDAEYAMLKSSVYELQIPVKLFLTNQVADFNQLHLSALRDAQSSQAPSEDQVAYFNRLYLSALTYAQRS
jgi:antitoxin component of RelBE/YafQ-DinJ toxin-antitoxin module